MKYLYIFLLFIISNIYAQNDLLNAAKSGASAQQKDTVKPTVNTASQEPISSRNLSPENSDHYNENFESENFEAIPRLENLQIPNLASAGTNPQFTVVLDAGHTPQNGGAVSCSGKEEVEFNDRFVQELQTLLEQAGIRVILTRRRGQDNLGLLDRAAIASQNQADLFISIHHDSAEIVSSTSGITQLQDTGRKNYNNRTIYCTIFPIKGFSVFVSQKNPQHQSSLQFAKILDKKIRSEKIIPASHNRHGQRKQLDPKKGVYQFDDLKVLKHNQIPAILLEVAVITDKDDERNAENPAYRQKIIKAILESIAEYQRTREL